MQRAKPLVALCLLGLAACEHDRYADRRDQITFGSGNAIAANKAMHVIDPWPREARTVTHGSSGEAAEAAMVKLRRRQLAEDPGAPAQPIQAINPAPNAMPKL